MATAPALWTCGCGAPATAGPCPQCGWERESTGQPDRSASRWLPVVAGLVTMVLAVDAVTLVIGLDDDTTTAFRTVEESIGDASDDEPDAPASDAPNRALPAALGDLLPGSLAGWDTISIPGMSGDLDLDEASQMGQEDDLASSVERGRLEDAGFVRGSGIVFISQTTDDVAGVLILEMSSVEAAEEYLSTQRRLIRFAPDVEEAEMAFVDDEVGFTYETGDGGWGTDVLYNVDQLVVRVYFASASRKVTESDLAPVHQATAASVGAA